MNITLMFVATNKYVNFLNRVVESADRYLLTEDNVSYLFFSNNSISINSKRPSRFVHIEHEPWPTPAMKKYDYISSQENELKDQDYLFLLDADMLFVDRVDREILSQRVGTVHPGYWNTPSIYYQYDRNPSSAAFIPYGDGRKYYAGAFNGGEAKSFLKMAKTISEWRKQDEKNGIIPWWHDESYLNKYYLLNPPTNDLSPSYCYPETFREEDYKSGLPFHRRLLALDKNHKEMRSE